MTSSNAPRTNSSNASGDGRQRLIVGAAVLIILSLGLNAYLLYTNIEKGEQILKVTNERDESEELKATLEKEYYEALSELEEQRGSNTELNTLIDQQKEELRVQKEQIERMLGDNRRLRQAREKIQELSVQADQYLAELNQLKAENQELTARNEVLNETNLQLETNLEDERKRAEELAQSQDSLAEQNQSLNQERENLSQTVERASVLKVSGIAVEGQKINNRGKPVRKKSAKNVEQLELCFDYDLNEVTPTGRHEFLVRIVNPAGVTVAIEDLGSDEFTLADTGETMLYTISKEIEYDQAAGKWCSVWAPNQAFVAGNYTVEVYHKGYLAGSSSFLLK